jgi:hypothetical protein
MSAKVTNKDIVLLGHGSYEGGATNTRLPENIDLYILQPLGYTLKTGVAKALIDQTEIKTLALRCGGDDPFPIIVNAPFVEYKGGNLVPDFTLYNLGELKEWGRQTIGNKTNVVTVDGPTLLSKLIKTDAKILEALKKLLKDEKLKLYWSACANQVSGYTASLV